MPISYSHIEVAMGTTGSDVDDPSNMPIVRLKLPWSWALGALGALSIVLIQMWSTTASLTNDMREIKTAVQRSADAAGEIRVEVSRLHTTSEETKRRLDRHLESPSRREN